MVLTLNSSICTYVIKVPMYVSIVIITLIYMHTGWILFDHCNPNDDNSRTSLRDCWDC